VRGAQSSEGEPLTINSDLHPKRRLEPPEMIVVTNLFSFRYFCLLFDYANTILLLASCHLNSKRYAEASATATTRAASFLETRKREIEKKYCKLSEHDLIIYARYFNAISLPLYVAGLL
jgi:hypothetical protein